MATRSPSIPAMALREALESPVHNRTLGKAVGRGELDYEVYLRTGELLSLQTPARDLVVGDELLFQITHQTQELWLKAVAHEGVDLVDALDAGAAVAALRALARMIAVTRCLARDIEVLFTLSPDAFLAIRRHLGNGSGLQSPGYNYVLTSADAVSEAFDRYVERRGTSVAEVYADRDARAEEHAVAEALVDWDGAFQAWLMAHFVVVRRTLGVDRSVRALDGFPTQALPARMAKPLFPKLWDVRVEMTRAWVREGGYRPGEERNPSGVQRVDRGEAQDEPPSRATRA